VVASGSDHNPFAAFIRDGIRGPEWRACTVQVSFGKIILEWFYEVCSIYYLTVAIYGLGSIKNFSNSK